MRKIQLIVLLFISATYFQSCKKDAITSASTISDKILAANINSVEWYPDTVSARISYNATTQIKTFSVIGTVSQKRVAFNINVPNSTNTNSFPLNTYKVDGTGAVNMTYYTQQKDDSGNYTFIQTGTVDPGSGSAIITAIDTVKKVITGTYSFTAKKVNYDSNGNYISIEINQILLGSFDNLPYIFNNSDNQ
ncbi:DUF6252 family protein [Mucilaginibacter sp. FT3.2]|uniref:DUF6252 family protein n=1 Tax=Mucilaginibacter sp. FT3.2 TaxID=2723090 RepID=UPI00161F607B|nr:DUF6252 family protein [Mucilaginibacter sp. FT3.2]MBB6234894.1 hypothetical protein [Mucilaginibacter sp. FT3.2]